MIGQDVVNAALEGMNLLFETFSRKGRKMPRLSIKVSDKNLIKVASFAGLRKDWCSYWIVPAIPESGVISVPSGFQFTIRAGADKDRQTLFIQNTAHSSGLSLAEGDYVLMVAVSFKPEPAKGAERIYPIDKGVYVCNAAYFDYHWVTGEPGDKSIPALLAKGTLVDTESKDYKGMEGLHSALQNNATTPIRDEKLSPHWHELENSVFDSESSAQSHPDFKDFDHIVINQKNPSNRHLHLMRMLLKDKGYVVASAGEVIPFEGDVRKTFPLNESSVAVTIVDVTKPSLAEIAVCEQILRQQGRAVIDTLNPSKDQLEDSARLLRTKGYSVFYGGDGNLDKETLTEFVRILRNHDYVSYHLLDDNYWDTILFSLRQRGYSVFEPGEYENRRVQVEDRGYESGYAKGAQETRRINESAKHLANRAYSVGFEAGRMVEKLGILNGEKSHDREERESASEGDSGICREGESRTVRWSSGRGGPTQSIRRTEPRSHSATQWADSEQPQYSEPGEPTGDSIHQADGTSPSECNENEKGDA